MARLNALSPTVASRQCVPILADEIYGDMVSVSCSPLHSQCYLSFLMHVILGHGSRVSRGEGQLHSPVPGSMPGAPTPLVRSSRGTSLVQLPSSSQTACFYVNALTMFIL